MAASVWSGYLTFGLISMPVRLFSGARSSSICFHMLHRDDMQRVKQQLICPAEKCYFSAGRASARSFKRKLARA